MRKLNSLGGYLWIKAHLKKQHMVSEDDMSFWMILVDALTPQKTYDMIDAERRYCLMFECELALDRLSYISNYFRYLYMLM